MYNHSIHGVFGLSEYWLGQRRWRVFFCDQSGQKLSCSVKWSYELLIYCDLGVKQARFTIPYRQRTYSMLTLATEASNKRIPDPEYQPRKPS